MIKKAFSPPDSYFNNSLEFINKIKAFFIPDGYTLISLDVQSLFTSIPKELIIDSLFNRISMLYSHCKIPPLDIIRCVEYLFDNTYLIFNNTIYKQIFGTPMGSPSSPVFADLVMTDLEVACLRKLKENFNCIPLFYFRYVDDTIMCIKNSDINIVLDTFNQYNMNLKFTHELPNDGQISFLDTKVSINNNKIISNWYTKPTSSGRFINFNSNHPKPLKMNMVYNLVDRAILLSNQKFHSNNIKKVKKLLLNNSYPDSFTNFYIKKRLCTLHDNNNKQPIPTVTDNNLNNRLFIIMPFINEDIYYKFKRLFKTYNIRTVPSINKEFQNIIRLLKDKTNKFEKTGIVYKIYCRDCSETSRELGVRINDHRTFKDRKSVVSTHMLGNNHEFNFTTVNILDTERSFNRRRFSEMLHINSNQHCINEKTDIQFLNKCYHSICKFSHS